MIPAFSFFLISSLKNRILFRLKRLRQPKYIVSVIAGAAYLYFIFFRRLLYGAGSASPLSSILDFEHMPLLEGALALLLILLVMVPWVFNTRARGLRFSEAEIQFLFPAPISRGALLNFRILKGQMGVLFGVLISGLFFGRSGGFAHPVFLFSTLWIVYSFLALYRMGTDLSKASLAQNGFSGFKRQIWFIACLAGWVTLAAVWIGWYLPSPPPDTLTFQGVAEWLIQVFETGPVHAMLLPFLTLVRPAFAEDWATFAARVLPALGVIGLTYFWVMRSDAGFEEASLERARKTATRLEAARRGGSGRDRDRLGKVHRPIFQLSPEGMPHVAIFWKNLISAGRMNPRRFLPIVVILVVVIVISTAGVESNRLAFVLGTTAAIIAAFLALLGPVLIRDDLRSDLLCVEVIKTYPISGWSVVLGEVMAPSVILGVSQWVLVFIAVLMTPAPAGESWGPYQRLVFGVSAAIILPCITAVGVLIQNGIVLIMPGWVHLGKQHQRGVEAMGQRLITMAATLLVMVLAVVPGSLLFLGVFLAGFWLIGLAVLPVAAIAAALGIMIEAGLAILWFGRIFDKFDASMELAEL